MFDLENANKHYEKLVSFRAPFLPLWQDISDLIIPKRGGITFKRSKGTKQTDRLFDSTAVHANELLAASMHGAMTSSATRWFSLKMRDEEMNDLHDVKVWLEEVADRMHLAFNQSNFAQEQLEAYLDLGAFGMHCQFFEEKEVSTPGKFLGFRFQTLCPGTYVINESPDGIVDEVWREFDMTARAIVQMFGDGAPQKIIELEQKEPSRMYQIIHGVFPRRDAERWGMKLLDREMKYGSVYYCKEHKAVLRESGFRTFPFLAPRWGKTSGEMYGRGPGSIALADIKTLNTAVDLKLKAWAKVIDPPLQATADGVIGGVRLTPAAINYVKEGAEIKPIESGARFDVTSIQEEKIQSSIRSIFFSDHLQLKDSPRMTAEEVRTRYILMQRLLGPTLGRLEAENFNPLIDRAFDMMFRAGVLPQLPDVLLQVMQTNPDSASIDVEYEGPLARAQKSDDVSAIDELLLFISNPNISAMFPDLKDNIDPDSMIRKRAEIRGVPEDGLRDPKVVDQIRNARNAANAEATNAAKAAAQAQLEKTQAETNAAAGAISPAIAAPVDDDEDEVVPGQFGYQ